MEFVLFCLLTVCFLGLVVLWVLSGDDTSNDHDTEKDPK
jgi:hypothetical protein